MNTELKVKISAMDVGIFSTDFTVLCERKRLAEQLATDADDSGKFPKGFDPQRAMRMLQWTWAKLKWHLSGLQTLRFLMTDRDGETFLNTEAMAFRDRAARGVSHP